MENVTIEVKTKQVGNSLAVFIPAEIKEKMNFKVNEKLIIHLHKKKTRSEVRGILAGKKIKFTEEDRLDARY